MARPQITLTPEQVGEVETLAALLNQDQIADYLGIARSTFHAICNRDPEVLERYKRGKAKAIAHVANGLLQRARAGCVTSSIFFLKTQAGWRETPVVTHRLGPADEPETGSAHAMLTARLDEIASRQAVTRILEEKHGGPARIAAPDREGQAR